MLFQTVSDLDGYINNNFQAIIEKNLKLLLETKHLYQNMTVDFNSATKDTGQYRVEYEALVARYKSV